MEENKMIKETITGNTIYFLGLLGVYLAPLYGSLIAVGVLIVIDLIFGICKTIKQKEHFSSRRFGDTLIKFLVYQLLIVSAHIVEVTLCPFIPFTQVTLSFIGITELISIGENFTIITGQPFLKYLKSTIANYFKNLDYRDKKKGN